MAVYYQNGVEKKGMHEKATAKRIREQKAQKVPQVMPPKAEPKKKTCLDPAPRKMSEIEYQFRAFLNTYSNISVMDPGMTKAYFEKEWCEIFWKMITKIYPRASFVKHHDHPINGVNRALIQQGLPYRVIYMNRQYSTKMFYYVYKIGTF